MSNITSIEELRQQVMTNLDDAEQTLYGNVCATIMINSAPEQLDCLVEPILPRVGVAALIGSSDSGKSSLLRALAMHICVGAPYFLGFEIKPIHRRALYISTEDDMSSVSVLMRKQADEMGWQPERLGGLTFLFEDDNLFETMEKIVAHRPHDLVIVDAFGDLYGGGMNDNNAVRNFLNRFKEFALRHSLLVIFLHHTGKRTETLSPSKHNAIGSQGFEAKMRFVVELRRDPDPERANIRHFCVVKGNYLPPSYKHSSYEMEFTPSLNFRLTGGRVPFELLREKSDDERRAEERRQVAELKAQGCSERQIAERVGVTRHAVRQYLHTPEEECPF